MHVVTGVNCQSYASLIGLVRSIWVPATPYNRVAPAVPTAVRGWFLVEFLVTFQNKRETQGIPLISVLCHQIRLVFVTLLPKVFTIKVIKFMEKLKLSRMDLNMIDLV